MSALAQRATAQARRRARINFPFRQYDWRVALILAGFAAVIFWKLLFSRDYTILWDYDSAQQSYAWFQYIAITLHKGSFPLWDPYTDAGRFFMAEVQPGAFYPLNWMTALFAFNSHGFFRVRLIEALVVFHVFLGSLFLYLLARHFKVSRFSALIGSIAFAYSGSIAARSQVNLLCGCIWIPAVLLCYFKSVESQEVARRVVWANVAGLCLAMTLLAGHHQSFLYCALTIALTAALLWRAISRRDRSLRLLQTSSRALLATTALVYVFGLAYSAVQLLPSMEYSRYAYRAVSAPKLIMANEKPSYEIASTLGALSPQGFADFIFPRITAVEDNPYFGILPLFLALLSLPLLRRKWVIRYCWVLVLCFVLLALGPYSPLHGMSYLLIPEYGKGRAPSRNLLLAHVEFGLLAAFGTDFFLGAFSADHKYLRKRATQALLVVSIIVSLVVFACFLYKSEVLGQPTNYDGIFFGCLLLIAACCIAVSRWHTRGWVLRAAILIVLLFDFYVFHNARILPVSGFDRKANLEPTLFYSPDPVLRFLQSRPGVFRVDFRDEYYPRNIGDVYGFDTVNAHDATRLKTYQDFGSVGDRAFKALNVQYIVTRQELSLPKVYQQQDMKVYENVGYLPRAWCVSQIVIRPSASQALADFVQPTFDSRQEASVEGTPNDLQSLHDMGALSSECNVNRLAEVSANRIAMEVHAAKPTFLVVSENWYPGWRATVNGQPRPILRVDSTLMGVWLDGGSSEIHLVFRPRHLWLGIVSAILASAVLLYCGIKWYLQIGGGATPLLSRSSD